VECVSGIHVIARSGVRLNYIVYNLSTSKIERDSAFPTEAQAFMGSYRSAITLLNPGDVSRQRNGSHLTLVNMFFYNWRYTLAHKRWNLDTLIFSIC